MLTLGCSDKLALPDLPAPQYGTSADTSYVQVTPVWTQAGGVPFAGPRDVQIGYDQFIYVCDTDNDRVVKLDLDGSLVESYSMVHPVAVTQDRGLDLIAVAGNHEVIEIIDDSTSDTTFYGNSIYRRRYFGDNNFEPVFTAPEQYHGIILHVPPDTIWVAAAFHGVTASLDPDKEYFVADFWKDRVLRFGADDTPISPPLIEGGIGVGLTDMPWDLQAFEIVGQRFLAYTQASGNLGVQVVSLVNGVPVFRDTTGLPEMVRLAAATRKQVAVDEFSNYYVLLYQLSRSRYDHHLLKFNRYGELLLEFGTTGSGERQFRNPQGLAYKDGTIYVADTGNDRIVRFRLSTELRQ
jgi:hypothetical protein